MTTHAQLAARLLREAAKFYRSLGEDNAEVGQRMHEFGSLYEQVADLVERDPQSVLAGTEAD